MERISIAILAFPIIVLSTMPASAQDPQKKTFTQGKIIVPNTAPPVTPTSPAPTTITPGGPLVLPPSRDPTVVSPQQPTVTVNPSRPALTEGPKGQSGPVCGGVVDGKAQASCALRPATFRSKARGTCPQGSFFDLGLWQCWSCTAGYSRTVHAVTSDKACSRPDSNVRGEYLAAQFMGRKCPEGSFFDPIRGGECWSCPPDYRRSAAHVEASNACFIPGGETFAPAVRHQKTIWPHDCKDGRFHDTWDGGNCWSCPGGYRRTGHPINDARACVANVPEKQARATLRKRAQCEPGEILDPRNDGECWRCPSGTDRTVFPIHQSQACERGGGHAFAKANFVDALTCPNDQIFDLIDGGTCWACPPNYKRTEHSVKSNEACRAASIEWKSAEYVHPGLFGIAGAEAVALDLIKEKTTIDALIAGNAETAGVPLAEARKVTWGEIATNPEQSDILKAAVLLRVVRAIDTPASATPAERQLVASFGESIRKYRVFLAKDALAAYDAWLVADQYWKRQRSAGGTHLSTAFNYGTVPSDFQAITSLTVGLSLASSASLGTLASVLTIPRAFREKIFLSLKSQTILNRVRFANDPPKKPITSNADDVAKIVDKVGKEVPKKPPAGLARKVITAFLKAGPQIIVTFAIELAAIAIEQIIEINEARPKLVSAIATAEQPVDFKRWLAGDDGFGQLVSSWALATTTETRPTNPGAFANAGK